MTQLRFHRLVAFFLFLPVAVILEGCSQTSPVDTVDIPLRNTETYEYPTVGGDEDGVTISRQARYYRVSEIRRNKETNWVGVYVYQPAAGFVGTDHAEIQIETGSDGASAPTNIRTVAFRFVVRD